jgi:hypothetical protein
VLQVGGAIVGIKLSNKKPFPVQPRNRRLISLGHITNEKEVASSGPSTKGG